MVSKVISVFVIVAVAAATAQDADRWPAGVNPALCPGYPICDNALLHTGTPGAESWRWNQWNHWNAEPLRSPLEINGVGGDRWPAGVAPAACPNYPYCGVLGAAAPLQGYTVRQYPAGVAPAACPNYPYCY